VGMPSGRAPGPTVTLTHDTRAGPVER
jgi:hypothetical protein